MGREGCFHVVVVVVVVVVGVYDAAPSSLRQVPHGGLVELVVGTQN